MRVDFLSIFPQMFAAVLGESILRIAQEKGLVSFFTHDIRDWSKDKHKKVDDKPFGGGPGMVLRVEPVVAAVQAVQDLAPEPGRLIFMTPRGKSFKQELAQELAQSSRLLLVSGRYEGFDQRIFDLLQPEEVSIGDYVLTGGELPAMVLADSVARLIPGVLGSPESLEHESFMTGSLDFPHYTQPADYLGTKVPEVLLSGNHALIASWRREKAKELTREKRPDLLQG